MLVEAASFVDWEMKFLFRAIENANGFVSCFFFFVFIWGEFSSGNWHRLHARGKLTRWDKSRGVGGVFIENFPPFLIRSKLCCRTRKVSQGGGSRIKFVLLWSKDEKRKLTEQHCAALQETSGQIILAFMNDNEANWYFVNFCASLEYTLESWSCYIAAALEKVKRLWTA